MPTPTSHPHRRQIRIRRVAIEERKHLRSLVLQNFHLTAISAQSSILRSVASVTRVASPCRREAARHCIQTLPRGLCVARESSAAHRGSSPSPVQPPIARFSRSPVASAHGVDRRRPHVYGVARTGVIRGCVLLNLYLCGRRWSVLKCGRATAFRENRFRLRCRGESQKHYWRPANARSATTVRSCGCGARRILAGA